MFKLTIRYGPPVNICSLWYAIELNWFHVKYIWATCTVYTSIVLLTLNCYEILNLGHLIILCIFHSFFYRPLLFLDWQRQSHARSMKSSTAVGKLTSFIWKWTNANRIKMQSVFIFDKKMFHWKYVSQKWESSCMFQRLNRHCISNPMMTWYMAKKRLHFGIGIEILN